MSGRRDLFFVVAECAEGSRIVHDGGGAWWEPRWVLTTLASFPTTEEAGAYAAQIIGGRSRHVRNVRVEFREPRA